MCAMVVVALNKFMNAYSGEKQDKRIFMHNIFHHSV